MTKESNQQNEHGYSTQGAQHFDNINDSGTIMVAITMLLMVSAMPVMVSSYTSPLFGWSNDGSMFKNVQDVRPKSTVTARDFLHKHVQTVPSSNVVIFVQEGLTLENLASQEMPFIKASMESSASSIFMPSVVGVESMLAPESVTIIRLEDNDIESAVAALSTAPDAIFVTGNPSTDYVVSRRARSTSTQTSTSTCNSAACRTYRQSSKNQAPISFATIPVLTALPPLFVIVVVLCAGIFGLMVLENNQKFPTVDDVPLIISTRNE